MSDEAAPPLSSFISQEVESSRLFFLEVPEAAGLAVAMGGFERCVPDYQIDRERVPWFCLEFVSRGRGRLELAGKAHPLQPGTFFVYGPETPHRIRCEEDDPLRKYFVAFTGAEAAGFLEGCGMGPGMVARTLRPEPVRRSFDLLIDRGVRQGPYSGALCEAVTRQLVLMCREDATLPVDTDTPAFASYEKVRDFIERHHMEVSTLGGIAAACGMEAPYVCRLFARFHGGSPYQFLVRLRMERASQWLLETGNDVRTVAGLLGFKDACHFSRVFKSVHRVPPSHFRNTPRTNRD